MSAQANRRILRDIAATQDPLLAKQGIWYVPALETIMKGKAIILGPPETPYEHCLGLFEFEFPTDYPFNPPKVKWATGDGVTRFHPQLYREGKVCLSILGTWEGPGWSGVLNLVSILQVLQSLLIKNPLICEPGFEGGNLLEAKHREYNDYVEHQFIQLMVRDIKLWESHPEGHHWAPFADEIIPLLPELKKGLVSKIEEKAKYPEFEWTSLPYSLRGRSFWKRLQGQLTP
jgi:ubiquitin-protein ligase